MNSSARKKLVFLTAMCFFLSIIENAFPKPVPFFRLGLANLPVMISFLVMSPSQSLLLVFLKILSGSVASGTLFSYIFLFSFCGSMASFLVMAALFPLKKRGVVSWVGVSLSGALANNFAQLVLSRIFIFGESTVYVAPYFLALSLASSIVLGLFAEFFQSRSRWLDAVIRECEHQVEGMNGARVDSLEEDGGSGCLKSRLAFGFAAVFCLGIVVFSCFCRSLGVLWAMVAVLAVAVFVLRRKVSLGPAAVMVVSVTAVSLLVPHGKILFELGFLKVTEGALVQGLLRSGRLTACVFSSRLAFALLSFFHAESRGLVAQVLSLSAAFGSRKGVALEGKTGFMDRMDSVLLEVWQE